MTKEEARARRKQLMYGSLVGLPGAFSDRFQRENWQ